MVTIPRKELRNRVGEMLRRAEAGERLIITVSGRPVAELGPVRARQWVKRASVADIWAHPPHETLARDLTGFQATLRDPWQT